MTLRPPQSTEGSRALPPLHEKLRVARLRRARDPLFEHERGIAERLHRFLGQRPHADTEPSITASAHQPKARRLIVEGSADQKARAERQRQTCQNVEEPERNDQPGGPSARPHHVPFSATNVNADDFRVQAANLQLLDMRQAVRPNRSSPCPLIPCPPTSARPPHGQGTWHQKRDTDGNPAEQDAAFAARPRPRISVNNSTRIARKTATPHLHVPARPHRHTRQ